VVTGCPVFASSATSLLPVDATIRGDACPSPGQYETPRRVFALRFVFPDLLSGHGVERVEAVLRGDVHDAVHDDRRTFEEAGAIAGVERPGALERADVARVDLGQRGVLRGGLVLAEVHPVVLRERRRRYGHRKDADCQSHCLRHFESILVLRRSWCSECRQIRGPASALLR
jgi:hypothetical protein